MNDGFLIAYEPFYFIVNIVVHKACRIYLFIYVIYFFMTTLSNHFYPGFFFAQISTCY